MSDYITPTRLKSEHGWTGKLIATYLGGPDDTARNPHYKSGPPMHLYSLARVAEAEKKKAVSDALATTLAKRESRSAAAKKAVQTKVHNAKEDMAQTLTAYLDDALADWSKDRLVSAACASYNRGDGIPDWARTKRNWSDCIGSASPDSDPDFLRRICCNFVRHNLVPYISALNGMHGCVSKGDARITAHKIVVERVSALLENTLPGFRQSKTKAHL